MIGYPLINPKLCAIFSALQSSYFFSIYFQDVNAAFTAAKAGHKPKCHASCNVQYVCKSKF
jgi:hypothetical protein